MSMKRNLMLSPDGTDGGAGTGTATADQGGAGGDTGEELYKGTGAEDAATDTGDEGGKGTGDDKSGKGGEGGEGAETALDKTTGLTKEDITEILKSAGVGERPAAAVDSGAKREPPSEAELEKMFNVWKPSPELIAQLRSEKPEDAIAALTLIRDGLLKQAMTMAEYRVQQLLTKLHDEQLAPLQTYVSEAQANSFRNDFFEKYPDLTKYESLVDAVAAKLQQAGFQGKSRDEVMKKFADETKAVVKTLLGAGSGNGAATGTETGAAKGKRQMSTLTGGGQGTGGGKGTRGDGAKGPPGIEVFSD